MKDVSFGALPLSLEQINRMDPRIRSRLSGWVVSYKYNGEDIAVPDVWNSKCYVFQYCEIYKTDESKENPGEAESAIQCYIGLGWPSCDFEVMIGLRVAGRDVKNPDGIVMCEIIKVGGARPMTVTYKGKFMTDFTQYALWGRFFKSEKAFVSLEVK